MVNDRDSPRKAYNFFKDRAQDGRAFTLEELATAVDWSIESVNTYKSKQWKDLLTKAGRAWTVRREFLRLSEKDFLDHVSQKRPLFASYKRKGHEHYVMFEFLLPLTREGQLRAALDELFYSDTISQRLHEIGQAKLSDVVPSNANEDDDGYHLRVAEMAAARFGGYSISHVSGRYKAAVLMTRKDALEHVTTGGRYLIDETTAAVRFIVPCSSGEFSFSDTLEDSFMLSDPIDAPREELENEVRLIRKLFFLLFAESVVRTVKGEDEIWLIESGVQHRLYRWERVQY